MRWAGSYNEQWSQNCNQKVWLMETYDTGQLVMVTLELKGRGWSPTDQGKVKATVFFMTNSILNLTNWTVTKRGLSWWDKICGHYVNKEPYGTSSVQSLSCIWLCDPKDCSTPGLPVHHQLLELAQTHDHWVSDASVCQSVSQYIPQVK